MCKNKVLDFRGLDCPEPLIKVTRELSRLSEGDTIIVLTDIEECVKAIKDLIESFEIGSLNIESEEKHFKIIINIKNINVMRP